MTQELLQAPPAKRPRQEEIYSLCANRQWQEVEDRVLTNPALALAKNPKGSSPLALACRAGAPVSCIKALLDAAPENVRVLLSSRGTPLHEAVICELVDIEAVRLLLEADEKLEGSPRAALMQDVDGHTPLHLLIRRRSPGHILEEDNSQWMSFFQLLVESCPEAAGVPDRGEYEEPPLVMALKANLYAATSADDDELLYPRYEMRIHEMANVMLKHYPQAASQTLEGARGQYTSLHSAVFHGRCSDTIQLLLQAEAETASPDNPKASLLANTQGEIPLHFAAMRGEPPRSIGLLGNAAPMAVQKRDTSGLTPLHWLWIRFVSTLLSLDDRQLTGTVDLEPRALEEDHEDCPYSKYWHVERGDFSQDLILMRKYDPPLDFFRMRHIPLELYDGREGNLSWAERPAEVLATMRDRDGESLNQAAEWTRAEVVSSLFWVKVVSLLKAFAKTQHDPVGTFHLVHTAMSSPCCPPPVAHITSLLFPDELVLRDSDGRFPLHHATLREWHPFDWKNDENDTAAFKLLEGESLELVKNAIAVSPPGVFRVVDHGGRLPLNHLINTFVGACSRCRIMSTCHTATVASMLDTLKEVVQRYPESLERRDGQTKLYPFLQATAAAASPRTQSVSFSEEMPLSIVYMLLRENPLLVNLDAAA